MPVEWLRGAATWAFQNPGLALTGVLGLVATAWAYDAYEDAQDRSEAVSGFAANAKSGFGSWFNLLGVALVGAVGGLASAGMTGAEGFGMLLQFVPDLPVFAAGLVTIGLGAIGISGEITILWWQFALLSLFALLLAVAWRVQE
jgi:hypothetical protein